MTLEFKTNYVLINDLQHIYKHKHLFNNTQCKIPNRHMSYHWSHYYAYGSFRKILVFTKQTHGPVKCISA